MNKKILFFFIVLFVISSVSVSADLTDGIVRYYALNQTSGTNIYNSVSGTNTATTGNEILFTSSSIGFINGSANFTAKSMAITDTTTDILGYPVGVGMWANISAYPSGAEVLWRQTGPSSNNRQLYYDPSTGGGSFIFNSRTSANSWVDVTISKSYVSLNQWNYIFLIENDTGLFIYVNDTLAGSYTTAYTKKTNFLNSMVWGGQAEGSGSQSFNGFMDEIVVYNRSILQADVTGLYDAGIDGIIYPFTTPEPEPETINITSVEITANTTSVVVDEVFSWSVSYLPANATNVSLLIDFDDAVTSTADSGTYAYGIVGLYNLSVNATDGQGNSVYDNIIINVSAVPIIPEEPVNMSNVTFTAVTDANISINGFSVSINEGVYFGTAVGTELVLSIPENDTINQLFNLSYSKFGYYTSTYEDINLSTLAHEGILVAKSYVGDESLDDKAVIWIIFALIAGIGISAIFSKPMLIVFGFSVMFLTYFLGGNIMVSYYWFNPLGYILGAVIILTGMMRLGFGD